MAKKGSVVTNMSSRVYRSRAYKRWFNLLGQSEKRVIDSRIDIFKKENILIKVKCLNKEFSLYEFKWDSGIRVYFTLMTDKEGNFMLLLIGGNKNTQKFDISHSKKIIIEVIKSMKKKEDME